MPFDRKTAGDARMGREPRTTEVDISVSVVAEPGVTHEEVVQSVREWLADGYGMRTPLPPGVRSMGYGGHKIIREASDE